MKYFGQILDFWLIMVYQEFEIQRNFVKARKLFHQALALNRTSDQFWVEYFTFELKVFILFEKRKQTIDKADNKVNVQDELELELELKSNDDDEDQKIGDDYEISSMEIEDAEENRAGIPSKKTDVVQKQFSEKKDESSEFKDANFADHLLVLKSILDKILLYCSPNLSNSVEGLSIALQREKESNSDCLSVISACSELLTEFKSRVTESSNLESNKQFDSFDLNSQIAQLLTKIQEVKNSNNYLDLLKCLSELKIGNFAQNNADSMHKLITTLKNILPIRNSAEFGILMEKVKYFDGCDLIYVDVHKSNFLKLEQFFVLLTKVQINNEFIRFCSNDRKKLLVPIIFGNMANIKIQEDTTCLQAVVEWGIKVANFNSDLLSVLAVKVQENDKYKSFSGEKKSVIFSKFLGLKNFCPKEIMLAHIGSLEGTTSVSYFDKILGYKNRDIDVWFCVMLKLKQNYKCKELEQYRQNCLKQFPEKANQISQFYDQHINF